MDKLIVLFLLFSSPKSDKVSFVINEPTYLLNEYPTKESDVDVICEANNGDKVIVLDKKIFKRYCHVEYNGIKGYIDINTLSKEEKLK